MLLLNMGPGLGQVVDVARVFGCRPTPTTDEEDEAMWARIAKDDEEAQRALDALPRRRLKLMNIRGRNHCRWIDSAGNPFRPMPRRRTFKTKRGK